jgi:hypothetical protein
MEEHPHSTSDEAFVPFDISNTPPPYFPVDYYVHNEENDFLDEAIALLNSIYPNGPADVEDVVMYPHDNDTAKHIILYNWIALSLVRKAERDVAAIAVYQHGDGVNVYWTKNSIDDEDVQHAEEFGALVRRAARDRIPQMEFQTLYFDMMTKNSKPKLTRRLSDFIAVSRKKEKYSSTHWVPPEDTDIEELDKLLAAAISMPQWYTQRDTTFNRADIEALKLGGFDPDTSGPAELYVSMGNILASIKKEVSEAKNGFTGDAYAALAAHAWMFGLSNVMEQLIKRFQRGSATFHAIGKIGEYFRGIGRLYHTMSARGFSQSFQAFRLIMITPAPSRQVELHDDWFHVIETIYYRKKGRVPDISRGRFNAKYANAVRDYHSWSKSFERHCEVSLIEALIAKKLPPVEIGVSKLCCGTCDRWIQGLNELRYNKRWYTAGCHGRMYLWARHMNPPTALLLAEDAVKQWVYDKIVGVVEPLIPRPGESPVHTQWEYDEELGGYNYPLVIDFRL